MKYPERLAEVLIYMGYKIDDDFFVGDNFDGKGPYFIRWDHSDPKPSAAALKKVEKEFLQSLEEQRGWIMFRQDRNELLIDSDLTQMPDYPMSATKKKAWKEWRQKVRDLPSDYPDLNDAQKQLKKLEANKP